MAQAGTLDDRYLMLNADNSPVTGNLALNQDLTVGGSAEFTGNVTTTNGGVFVNRAVTGDDASMLFAADANTGTKFSVTRQGTYIGDNITGAFQNANIQLLNNGSASFAGDGHFKCGGTDPEHGVQFINDGEVKIWRPTGGGASVNLISGSAGTGSQNEMFAIKADGSAEFAGRVDVKGGVTVDGGSSISTGFYYRDDTEENGLALYSQGSSQSNRKVFIKTDGSAEFAGGNIELTTNNIIIKNDSGGLPDTNYTEMSRLGGVDMYRSGANPQNDTVFRLRTNPAGTELTPIEFKGDGSAEFAGSVKASRGIFRNNNNEHVIVGEATLGSANYSAIQLKTDGSAEFASTQVELMSISDKGAVGLRPLAGNQVYLNAKGSGVLGITYRQSENYCRH